jgi:hypothetical protein
MTLAAFWSRLVAFFQPGRVEAAAPALGPYRTACQSEAGPATTEELERAMVYELERAQILLDRLRLLIELERVKEHMGREEKARP